MSDTTEPGAPAPADTSFALPPDLALPGVAGAEPEPAPPAEPEAAPQSALDVEWPADAEQFPRTYVSDLRTEAARYRDDARAAREQLEQVAFLEQFAPEDRQAVLTLWSRLADQNEDPRVLAADFKALADVVEGWAPADEEPAPVAEGQEAFTFTDAYGELDPAKIQALVDARVEQGITRALTAREQQQLAEYQQHQAIENAWARIEGLGFARQSDEAAAILSFAAQSANQGMGATAALEDGIARYQAFEAKLRHGVVEAKQRIPGSPPSPDANPTAAIFQVEPPKTFKEAAERTRQWLAEQGQ